MIYSIGHSTHPIGKFIALLKQHKIATLADVRSVPISRYNPQFRQDDLRASLQGTGIQYVYLGETLGGRPRLPYDERVRMERFHAGLKALIESSGR